MLTLSNGYKKPETGDKGSVFYVALEGNIQLLNDHDHDGVNSNKLTSSSVTTTVATILAASHTNDGNGMFSQVITVPIGFSYDNYRIEFRNATTGDQLYLTAEKESATTYTVRINDNSFDLTAMYIS